MTDEDLWIEGSLVPPEHEGQWQLDNHRCLGECNGKRMMSQNDGRMDLTVDNKKHEPWCHVMKRDSGKGALFCSNCPKGKCDVVICFECMEKTTVWKEFDKSATKKRQGEACEKNKAQDENEAMEKKKKKVKKKGREKRQIEQEE